MEQDTLALELLKQVKADSRKWFIAFIITLIMLFISNLAWLYAWNLPTDEVADTQTYDYDINSEDNGNAIYNDSGEVKINGKSTEDSN